MAGARGDALDWALALARAPTERSVLRQRPLPEGIGALLQIAAGHKGDALSSAVSRSGESEKDLVEATRFYLREVLFHSNADAYRILGLERGATADEIKGHHRWLQQWLHPDRHTSDWDAIFAGRVNAAWNQLRNPERRQAYDAEHTTARPATGITLSPVLAGWVNPANPPDSPRERWQRRWPLLALLGACVGLGLMALRDLAGDQALLAAGAPGGAQPAYEDSSQHGDSNLDSLGNLHIPEPVVLTASKAAKAKPAALRRQVAIKPSAPVAATGAVIPAPDARSAVRKPAATTAKVPTVSSVAPARTVTAQPAVSTRPTAASAPPSTVAAPPTAGKKASPVAASPMQAVRSVPGVLTPAAAIPPAAAEAPTVGQPSTPLSATRVRQAQQVGDRLVAYMGKPGTSIPSIWDSPAAQRGATQLRDAMLADGRPEMAQADWRVGESEARMRVAIRHPDGRQGHLDAVLVWREERWLVRRLSMERDW